jgi:glycosyltransferase involved in cell wall biosynthesis
MVKLKILFFGAYFPRPNNPTTGIWALAQIAALRDAGHEVRVISPLPAVPLFITRVIGRGTSAACPARHQWNGIETHYVRWPIYPVGPLAQRFRDDPGFFLRIAWALSSRRFLKIAAEFRPGIVFAHHGQLGGFVASKVAHRIRVPFFVTEHSFGEIESCAKNPRRKRLYAQMLGGISGWIAVSERMLNTMREIFPDAPSLTLHNGAELIPAELRDVPRPPLLAGRSIVLCVTFFYKRKNVPLLVKSFDRIAARHPSALLLIAGDGDDRPNVISAIESAHHRSQIMTLGALSHRDVLQHMLWCDVFAHIGINEPFGTVFSEAMMAGKPIIFARDGGIADVVRDGVHGLGVAPNDEAGAAAALDSLLSDSDLRLKLAAAAADLAHTELTWPGNVSRLTRLFEAARRV